MRKGGIFLPQIKVTAGAAVFFVLLFVCDSSIYTWLMLSAAAIHEIGHAAAIALGGSRVECITVYPFGVDIKTNGRYMSYGQETFVYIAGPLANILTAAGMYFLFAPSYPLGFFIMSNAVFAVLNLMPVSVFDGGRALEAVLSLKIGYAGAAKILKTTSFASVIIIWIAAVWALFYTGGNFSLFAMSVYLFFCLFLRGDKSI